MLVPSGIYGEVGSGNGRAEIPRHIPATGTAPGVRDFPHRLCETNIPEASNCTLPRLPLHHPKMHDPLSGTATRNAHRATTDSTTLPRPSTRNALPRKHAHPDADTVTRTAHCESNTPRTRRTHRGRMPRKCRGRLRTPRWPKLSQTRSRPQICSPTYSGGVASPTGIGPSLCTGRVNLGFRGCLVGCVCWAPFPGPCTRCPLRPGWM